MIDQENFGEKTNGPSGGEIEGEIFDPNQFLFADLGEMTEGPSLPILTASPLTPMMTPSAQAHSNLNSDRDLDSTSDLASDVREIPANPLFNFVSPGQSGELHELEWESLASPEELGTKIPTDDEADFALSDEGLKRDIRNVPDRMAFKIGDVAHIVGVKTYVLRYWETEFEALKPKKSKFNQRMYTRRDVEVLLMIKKLLYHDRFSIEGARLALRRLRKEVRVDRQWDTVNGRIEQARERLEDLIGDLREMKDLF